MPEVRRQTNGNEDHYCHNGAEENCRGNTVAVAGHQGLQNKKQPHDCGLPQGI